MINHRRRVAFDGAADRDGFILRDSINRRLVIVAHGHIWIKLWDIFQICNRLRRCFLRWEVDPHTDDCQSDWFRLSVIIKTKIIKIIIKMGRTHDGERDWIGLSVSLDVARVAAVVPGLLAGHLHFSSSTSSSQTTFSTISHLLENKTLVWDEHLLVRSLNHLPQQCLKSLNFDREKQMRIGRGGSSPPIHCEARSPCMLLGLPGWRYFFKIYFIFS